MKWYSAIFTKSGCTIDVHQVKQFIWQEIVHWKDPINLLHELHKKSFIFTLATSYLCHEVILRLSQIDSCVTDGLYTSDCHVQYFLSLACVDREGKV